MRPSASIRSASLIFSLAALVALAALPAGAATTQTERYVVGLALPGAEEGVCATGPGHLVGQDDVFVGGNCGFPVQPGAVTIQVIPDAGAARFSAKAFAYVEHGTGVYERVECGAQGRGDGALTLDLPDGCVTLAVYVELGSVSGTILVTQP